MQKFRFQTAAPNRHKSNPDPTGQEQDMLEYYETRFDSIRFKYDIPAIARAIQKNLTSKQNVNKLDDILTPQERQAVKCNMKGDDSLTLLENGLANYFHRFESSNELSILTKRDYSHVMANLYMIYHADQTQIEQQAQIIDKISNKVIGQYIGIDGLERLFNEQYIDFEWEMHLGMDHLQHKMDFYRDHFIHQVRDAYMLDKLLQTKEFYNATFEVLTRPDASKVSQYFCKMVERQKQAPAPPTWKYLHYDKNFIPRNIIFMSAYMAGLFHDIGYPETYLRDFQRRISEYLPSIAASGHRSTEVAEWFPLLQNSLLFRVVPIEEIQDRVNCEKIDHGTLSALTFLLHFYENGVIFKLEPYKAAAIEIAALAIYNHTYKYSITGKPLSEADDYRPRFVANPISYLLRICDDLQEWDRVYFEVSSRSNILICPKCNTPIIGRTETRAPGASCTHRYVCNCEETLENTAFYRAFDEDAAFPYRRLYNVQVCDWVDFRSPNPDDKVTKQRDLVVRLHYDPYRLLHISYISPNYAKYRIDELNKLKPLLIQQGMIPRIWLDYYVTANPILIKVWLIRDYLKSRKQTPDIYQFLDVANGKQLLERVQNEQRRFFGPIIKEMFTEILQTPIFRSVLLYFALYIYYELCLEAKRSTENTVFRNVAGLLVKELYNTYYASDDFNCLLGDSITQLSRLYPWEILKQSGFPKGYMEQFRPDKWKDWEDNRFASGSPDFYYSAIARYTDQQTYRPYSKILETGNDHQEVDAFTDLGFFHYISSNQKMGQSNGQ